MSKTLNTIIKDAEFMSDLEIEDVLLSTGSNSPVVVKSINREKRLIGIQHVGGLVTTVSITTLRTKYYKR